jgi:organic hydroperoxide reductase OsmC/OhrA
MAELKIKTKQFIYRNSLKWKGEKKGLLSSQGKPDIELATPLEFKGHSGIWSPEDLFVASVNCCFMTTFLHYTYKNNFNLLSYESQAEGILERIEDKFIFSKIKITPKIVVAKNEQIEKAKEIIELAEKNCPISHSMKSKIEVTPEIRTEIEQSQCMK